MKCYRDMTFCSFYFDCADGLGCKRILTNKIVQEAKDAGLYISYFAMKPKCYKQIDNIVIKSVTYPVYTLQCSECGYCNFLNPLKFLKIKDVIACEKCNKIYRIKEII